MIDTEASALSPGPGGSTAPSPARSMRLASRPPQSGINLVRLKAPASLGPVGGGVPPQPRVPLSVSASLTPATALDSDERGPRAPVSVWDQCGVDRPWPISGVRAGGHRHGQVEDESPRRRGETEGRPGQIVRKTDQAPRGADGGQGQGPRHRPRPRKGRQAPQLDEEQAHPPERPGLAAAGGPETQPLAP